MSWWLWYLIGGGLGLAHMAGYLASHQLEQIRFRHSGQMIKGAVTYAALMAGAAVYGTGLWLLFGVVLKI